jgi:phosphoribosylformylglycinamidine cyclo-ligase
VISEKLLFYESAGVDLHLGNMASKILYEAAKQTWKNRTNKLGEIIVPFDDYSGLRAIRIGNLPQDTVACLGFDGVGTKIEIAERVGRHDTIAFDLFAMVCDDAAVRGGIPIVIGSVLDVRSLSQKNNGIEVLRQIANGYIAAAESADVAVINGELAELGTRIAGFGDFNYTWSAGVLWVAQESKLLTGSKIQNGDTVIALREHGFRSNGLSLVRKVFSEKLGSNWHQYNLNGKNLGELVLTPSIIYSKIISAFRENLSSPDDDIHAIAHITGGGIPEKIGRMLQPTGLGMNIDNLFPPCDAMQFCQEAGTISDAEMYRTCNMGNGMFIVTSSPEILLAHFAQHRLEAKIAGKIIAEKNIVVTSCGMKNGTILEFPLQQKRE